MKPIAATMSDKAVSNPVCRRPPSAFSEAEAWREVGGGWMPLYGGFRGRGCSIEWHDFYARRELDWAASFHPNGVELCLNMEGHGFVAGPDARADFAPNTAGFYHRTRKPLTAGRAAGEQHRFLTVEFSCPFLAKHLSGLDDSLHPIIRAAVSRCPCEPVVGATVRLSAFQRQLVATLRHPPVRVAAQPLWFQCKALELAVGFLLQPPPEEEFFCTRQQRLAQERVESVISMLRASLAEPPSLETLAKNAGCSPFYLSRIVSAHTGQSIPQHLRQLQMEKAAELLRSGRHNVTEAAMEVGYSSLSHFSAAFRETFGCCPGLFPVAIQGAVPR